MKPIKITEKNNADLEAALAEVNGRANAHTADASFVMKLAENGEADLDELMLPSKNRAGAIVEHTSGDNLPNSYAKLGRKVRRTTVKIERRPSGWYLTDAKCIEMYANQSPGRPALTLTREQDEVAIARLRSCYKVAA